MVIERVEILIKPGQEEAFEAALGRARALLVGATGCRAVTAGRGVEAPSKFLLLLEWESVDHHIAFTKTPEFKQFGELVGPTFAGRPAMEHFSPLPG